MRWTCEEIEDRLSDYLDGLLEDADRQAFQAHAEGCARCAALLREVEGAVAELRALPPAEPSPWLFRRILDATLGPRPARQRSWKAWLRPLVHPRFAFGLASLLVTFAVVLHALGPSPSLASFSPVRVYRVADRRSHLGYARLVKFVNDLRLVYEIQSRLQPEAGAVETPGPLPRVRPGGAKKPAGRVDPVSALPSLSASAKPRPFEARGEMDPGNAGGSGKKLRGIGRARASRAGSPHALREALVASAFAGIERGLE
jgi:Putative zinc-finger